MATSAHEEEDLEAGLEEELGGADEFAEEAPTVVEEEFVEEVAEEPVAVAPPPPPPRAAVAEPTTATPMEETTLEEDEESVEKGPSRFLFILGVVITIIGMGAAGGSEIHNTLGFLGEAWDVYGPLDQMTGIAGAIKKGRPRFAKRQNN